MAKVKVRVAVVVMAEVLVACRAPVPPVPGKGGPAWIELTSPHFTVWTDAEPEPVRELVRKMERLRLILVDAVFPTAPAQGRDLAIVLRDDAELKAFSQTGQARPFAAQVQLPLWQPMLVLSASAEHDGLEVDLAHELVHTISYGVIHHQPRWFCRRDGHVLPDRGARSQTRHCQARRITDRQADQHCAARSDLQTIRMDKGE